PFVSSAGMWKFLTVLASALTLTQILCAGIDAMSRYGKSRERSSSFNCACARRLACCRRARRPRASRMGTNPNTGKDRCSMKILIAIVALLIAGASAQASCTSEVGAAKANEYVRHCRDVSPATRPPCNAANACSLILAEIRRGCAFLKEDAPAYCRA